MEIAPSFKKLVRLFNVSSIPQPFDEREWIDGIVSSFEPSLRQESLDFITKILGQERSTAELQALWKQAGSEFYINDDGILPFLEMVRKALLSTSE